MVLSKYKLGDLISLVDERNSLGIRNFYGISINKEFMPTAAQTDDLDESIYKVVRKNRFVFSGMQTGRDKCIRISMYEFDEPILVSPAYTTFEITKTDIVEPTYFFMTFRSKEKDRLGWFLSDSSVRANLDWKVFCEITIELPSIEIQRKYVAVYNAMVENQKAYEKGLEDLKLTCDAYIEELRRDSPSESIGHYLIPSDTRNNIGLDVEKVRGLAVSKEIISTKADMDGVGLDNYKLLPPEYIAYVPDTSRRGDKVSMGYNNTEDTYLVSSISSVFTTQKEKLIAKYLMLFFSRDEFNRYARFHSWGSARETFDWSEMCSVKIPIPDVKVQKAISDIYTAYTMRKEINEQLKAQIKDICPILIKGSLAEARA